LEYRSVLKEKADFLKDNPDIHIRIEGNCDERGTNEYNLALGEYGEERPLASGYGEGAWAQNRRDDFTVIAK
jgi:peptidoglycan-associated lipoprotein